MELDQALLDRAAERYLNAREGVDTAEDLICEAFEWRSDAYYAHLDALVKRFRDKCLCCGRPVPPAMGRAGSRKYCELDACGPHSLPHASGDTKICAGCGDTIVRMINHGAWEWRRKRFCDKDCQIEATDYSELARRSFARKQFKANDVRVA